MGWLLNRVARKAWKSAHGPERNDNRGDPSKFRSPGYGTILKDQPLATPDEETMQYDVHFPAYIARFLYCFLISYPILLLRLFFNMIIYGHRHSKITELDVWNLLTDCSVIFACELETNENNELIVKFDIPADIPTSKSLHPKLELRDFHLKINSKTKKVVSAVWHGDDIVGQNDKILALISSAIETWIHPQLHVSAEIVVRAIRDEDCEILKNTSYFTLSLHEGLMNSSTSPINPGNRVLYSLPIADPADLIARFSFPYPHYLDDRKEAISPLYKFLHDAKFILERLHTKYNIPKTIQVQDLYNAIIIHTIDHENKYRILTNKIFSFDLTYTYSSYYHYWTYTEIWLSFVENKRFNERIRGIKDGGFYEELYNELKEIDPTKSKRYVNQINASISF